MAVEAVNFIHDDNVEFAFSSIVEHLLKGRTPASFLGRNACIHINFNQFPAMFFGITADVDFLGIQAVSIDLIRHGHPPVAYSPFDFRFHLLDLPFRLDIIEYRHFFLWRK
nr:hypothetical protein [Anaerolinea sp.]